MLEMKGLGASLRKNFCEVLGLWSLGHIKRVLCKYLTAELGCSFCVCGGGVRFDTSVGKIR